ncbi:hypothetical protein EV193_11728 [Herbihabitans rhizosphaerae]|uniref:PIN domain-containing protein n=1 Tax=Herbihabitans rhizosphaerae TaxID=1872711 RepID=A0A4V2ERC1_9PSEU|nr:hypothetical protein [Herbihabitans rhizosphaerae]RZS30332.1 hypothetical protein EV193_11728 [Herbihabitans rhizosphaerae]
MTGSAVYDAGMLIALAKGDNAAEREHWKACQGLRPIVPGPVLGQVWRGARQHSRLSFALRRCDVRTAYSEADYKRVGEMLGEVALGPRKRPDVVDALVAYTAVACEPAIVLTSDPGDIEAYLATLRKARTMLVPV